MFVLCTMHVGLSFTRVIHAFFGSQSPAVYLQDITTTLSRFQYGVHMVQVFISDLLIVYRSYVLWNKNYFVVLVPLFFVLATMVTGGGALQAMASTSHTAIFEGEFKSWVIATLALTLATKAVCLFLVTFRVRQIHAFLTSHVNRHITVYTLIVVLVESGAAALLASVILLPMFATQRNEHFIVWNALSPVMSIVFTTIIAGMTLNLANQSPAQVTVTTSRPRFSIPPRSPISTRPPKGEWYDSQDFVITPATSPSPSSPVLSRPPSIHDANESTGTLNMGIVI